MNTVLHPYSDFNQAERLELAGRLHDLVNDNRELLHTRHLLGVIARYGQDVDLAERNIRIGQSISDQRGVQPYAIIDETGDVQGTGSVYPGLPLRELRLPVPPRFAIRGISERMPRYFDLEIHAWTDKNHIDLLSAAYTELLEPARKFRTWLNLEVTWTTEPTRTPKSVHEAIVSAGLRELRTSRYDDKESRHIVPPRSVLYVEYDRMHRTTHQEQNA